MAVSACGVSETGQNSADPAVVHDSGGVEIVVNRGTGWMPESGWRLELDLEVGERDGPAAFGRIAWVAPGPNGGMLVLDSQSSRVHEFDSLGAPIREFGGEGDGPGEFGRPASVTVLRDGRIAVAQTFPPVLYWMSGAGEYLGSTRLPISRDEAGTRTAGAFGLWQVTPDGRVFVQAQVIDPGAGSGGMPVALLEVDPAGEDAPDTIARWTWDPGIGEAKIRAFEPVHTWMPTSDGVIVLAPGDPYEVYWEDPSAGRVRVMRRDIAPVPITERHRHRALEDMRAGMEEGGAPSAMVDEMLSGAEFESTMPPVLRVWVSDPDDRLWIGVHDPALFEGQEEGAALGWDNAWDVFEPDGRYLGRLPVPDGFRPRVVTEQAVYGVWEDELEVPFARRYRVVRP
ncbi:MAG: hypothetical protein Q8W45_09140 [Candidatus Palauibacterales bacterium]|nr:hypothetical protein [Candidatus Palauibacterales bacterium]MDP2483433.1 hypothetical protein [Candidatus Palauibacterales bacterium]